MARVQPVLSASELALVDQMAELTHAKRTDVIKNALGVYHWFVRQALTGSRVIARKPTGEEVTLETAELSGLKGTGTASRRGAGTSSERARDSARSDRGRPHQGAVDARLLRDLSGRAECPKTAPSARFAPAPARTHPEPQIPATQLELLATWLDTAPEVPDGEWYKRFSSMTVCGEVS